MESEGVQVLTSRWMVTASFWKYTYLMLVMLNLVKASSAAG